jgi:hypothetical protein
MGVNVYRNYNEWKPAKGGYQREASLCPRCHNMTEYTLVWDGSGIGLPGIWTFKYNKQYALKCPICPNFEPVSNEVAEALIKGVR